MDTQYTHLKFNSELPLKSYQGPQKEAKGLSPFAIIFQGFLLNFRGCRFVHTFHFSSEKKGQLPAVEWFILRFFWTQLRSFKFIPQQKPFRNSEDLRGFSRPPTKKTKKGDGFANKKSRFFLTFSDKVADFVPEKHFRKQSATDCTPRDRKRLISRVWL